VVFSSRSAVAADFLLAGWENNGTGSGGPGTDFDTAPIDGTPSCTGCWLKGNTAVQTTLTQSTIGVTQGTKSLKLDFVGKGLGGGDGLQDTHFDRGARVFWSVSQNDPRALALRDAINGNQGLFKIEIDVTYDIPALRSLHWLGPPVDFPAKPVNFIGLGLYKSNNNDGGPFTDVLEQVLPTLINPNDPQFDGVTYLTRRVSIPLSQFNFTPNPANPPTFYEMGFSLNGNWGTNPSASNTEAAAFYLDNMLLVEFIPEEVCDMNGDDLCTLADFQLFMSDHLKTNPTYGDLVGDFGAQGTNGKNDLHDFVEFERTYDLANGGAGSLKADLAGVPEPGSLALAWIAAALATNGRRRLW
jgi:hypothetical protein